jgi:pimeloyl-ACP methyl ester carboxylesterase
VSLAAWSYAGHVALHAARSRPDLFARILAYEPGIRTIPLEPDEQDQFCQDAQAMFGPIFAAAGGRDLEQAVRLLIDASGGPGHYDALPEEVRRVLSDNDRTIPPMLAQQEPPAMSLEDLSALPMPVTVAWGERTRPVFKLPTQAVARGLSEKRHEEVPGVGHLWPIDDAEGFAAFVERWLHGGQ